MRGEEVRERDVALAEDVHVGHDDATERCLSRQCSKVRMCRLDDHERHGRRTRKMV